MKKQRERMRKGEVSYLSNSFTNGFFVEDVSEVLAARIIGSNQPPNDVVRGNIPMDPLVAAIIVSGPSEAQPAEFRWGGGGGSGNEVVGYSGDSPYGGVDNVLLVVLRCHWSSEMLIASDFSFFTDKDKVKKQCCLTGE